MSESSEQQVSTSAKADPVLASLYEEQPALSQSRGSDSPATEEKKHESSGTQSGEGKLKLFLGGLYFQTEQDIRDYFKKLAPVLQFTLITDRSNTGSKGYAFITLEDKDGTVRKKVLSTTHYIKGKLVDLKLEDTNKKVTDQLSVNKKIFVGGLDPGIDAAELRKFFEQFGGVQDAIVIRNVSTNASRGFGFVTFDSDEVADKCVRENSYKLKGKRVDIKKADPRQTRPRQPRVYYPIGRGEAPIMGEYPNWPWNPYAQGGVPAPLDGQREGMMMPQPPYGMFPPGMMRPMMPWPDPRPESGSNLGGKSAGGVGPIKTFEGKSKTYAPY